MRYKSEINIIIRKEHYMEVSQQLTVENGHINSGTQQEEEKLDNVSLLKQQLEQPIQDEQNTLHLEDDKNLEIYDTKQPLRQEVSLYNR